MINFNLYNFTLDIIDNKIPNKELCLNLVENTKDEYKLLFLLMHLPFNQKIGNTDSDRLKTIKNLVHSLAQQIDFNLSLKNEELYTYYLLSCKYCGDLEYPTINAIENLLNDLELKEDVEIFLVYNIIGRLLSAYSTLYIEPEKIKTCLNKAEQIQAQYQNISNILLPILYINR